jgi:hypothetical protein
MGFWNYSMTGLSLVAEGTGLGPSQALLRYQKDFCRSMPQFDFSSTGMSRLVLMVAFVQDNVPVIAVETWEEMVGLDFGN